MTDNKRTMTDDEQIRVFTAQLRGSIEASADHVRLLRIAMERSNMREADFHGRILREIGHAIEVAAWNIRILNGELKLETLNGRTAKPREASHCIRT